MQNSRELVASRLPTLLDHALRLREAGIDIEVSAMVLDLLRRRLAQAVNHTVTLSSSAPEVALPAGGSPEELATRLGAPRPVIREATGVILAQEVELVLVDLMQSGQTR